MMEPLKDEYVRDISKLMKSISHPIRFKILCLLQDEEVSVGDLVARLESSNSNISQHLNILRNQGVIDYRKDANYIYNRITDWRVIELIRKVHQLYFLNPPSTRKPYLDI
jgi:DNA-binding transcriptional ArsR family regulator